MARKKPKSRAAATKKAAQKKSSARKVAAKSHARKKLASKGRAAHPVKRARPKQRIAISHYREEIRALATSADAGSGLRDAP